MTIECHTSDSQRQFEFYLNFVVYYIILPIYFVLGIAGNTTLLLAFRRQAKTDKAYAYQIFSTVTKLLEILFSGTFWWGYKWYAGIEKPGVDWYMNSYAAMLWAGQIGNPFANGFIITSLLFSVAMTADRIFALAKPFVYKTINQRRHHALACILCVLIGLGTSAFEVRRRKVIAGVNTTYVLQFDEEYLNTPGVMFLGHLRTSIRLVCLVGLIVLNVIMTMIFRRRTRKVAKLTAGASTAASVDDRKQSIADRKESERKSADKQLLVLTIYNSCLTAFAHIPHSIYFLAAIASTTFDVCYGPSVSPFADGAIMLADAGDLFIIVAINKKMRQTVFRVLPCCKGASVESVNTRTEPTDQQRLSIAQQGRRASTRLVHGVT